MNSESPKFRKWLYIWTLHIVGLGFCKILETWLSSMDMKYILMLYSNSICDIQSSQWFYNPQVHYISFFIKIVCCGITFTTMFAVFVGREVATKSNIYIDRDLICICLVKRITFDLRIKKNGIKVVNWNMKMWLNWS